MQLPQCIESRVGSTHAPLQSRDVGLPGSHETPHLPFAQVAWPAPPSGRGQAFVHEPQCAGCVGSTHVPPQSSVAGALHRSASPERDASRPPSEPEDDASPPSSGQSPLRSHSRSENCAAQPAEMDAAAKPAKNHEGVAIRARTVQNSPRMSTSAPFGRHLHTLLRGLEYLPQDRGSSAPSPLRPTAMRSFASHGSVPLFAFSPTETVASLAGVGWSEIHYVVSVTLTFLNSVPTGRRLG